MDAAAEIKACCAAGYSSDLVSMLLGDSYHPGGLGLTRHLLDALDLRPGDRVVDVACGIGTTSLVAAQEYATTVAGVDLSEANVARAGAAATEAGLRDRVGFWPADAEALPFGDAECDAVICECALCTFPDKSTAVGEMARVLRPGGRVGITDVTAHRERLPQELTGLGAWVACVADARPAEEYEALVTAHGLEVRLVEWHHRELDRLVLQLGARIELLRMTQRRRVEDLGLDIARAAAVVAAARDAIASGALGYVLLVAEKPR